MSEILLKAGLREKTGSNANKRLRREELIPAVLYQKDEENQNLTLVAKEFDKVIAEAGTSTIISLDIEGSKKKVLIRDFQRHPYKNMFMHVDLLGVNMKERLKVNVPIVLLNRDEIYLQPSVLMQAASEIEIECLPSDIPAQVEIDVQNMQYGDTFTVADLDIVKNEDIQVLTDLEEVICSLQEPREEVVEEDEGEEVSAADVEVIGEKEEAEEE